MTSQEAFLQAIIENPDDDAPRLIFADWLDEHGQSERAEFIRIQCQLAHMVSDDSRLNECADRMDEVGASEDLAFRKFIRLQSKLRRLGVKAALLSDLCARESELLAEYGRTWAEPISENVSYTFRRGFIEVVETSDEMLLSHADHLFQSAPIQEVICWSADSGHSLRQAAWRWQTPLA